MRWLEWGWIWSWYYYDVVLSSNRMSFEKGCKSAQSKIRNQRQSTINRPEESNNSLLASSSSSLSSRISMNQVIQHPAHNNNALYNNFSTPVMTIPFSDPLFSRQWYLYNRDLPGHDINVMPVWQEGITGRGVVIALIDDGIDYQHDDLRDNFRADLSYDFNTGHQLPIPDPNLRDHHGTRCAGQLVARPNNGVCGVGIAPGAQVSALRILSMAISSRNEAAAVTHRFQDNHIYSCSWGPADDGRAIDRPDPTVLRAFIEGLVKGRGGHGSIYVFAAGNGRAVDNCNYDGYASGLFALTVGAIDHDHRMPRYMEPCAAQLVVAYSSNDQHRIATTDLGSNKCTLRHGGTSAAAPMVAGILALVLEVRPNLTWRDVRYLCVETAQLIAEDDPSWAREGSSRPYSYKFGFGKIDAHRMVKAARTWQSVPPQIIRSLPMRKVNLAIGLGQLAIDEFIIDERIQLLTHLHPIKHLEYVTVQLDIDHSRRGDLVIHLTSPSGRTIPLATRRPNDASDAGLHGIIMMTPGFWGQPLEGLWKLSVANAPRTSDSKGTLISYQMTFWGATANHNATTDKIKNFNHKDKEFQEELYTQDFFNAYYPPSEEFFADRDGLWKDLIRKETTRPEKSSPSQGFRPPIWRVTLIIVIIVVVCILWRRRRYWLPGGRTTRFNFRPLETSPSTIPVHARDYGDETVIPLYILDDTSPKIH